MPSREPAAAVPRLTYLRIRNFRALRDVEFRDLTPLTVLVGPNGSGKSTVLDALAFLAEAVSGNLTQAWEKRNRFQGMRTRGSEGNIEFEVEIKVSAQGALFRYYIEFAQSGEQVIVNGEWLKATKNQKSGGNTIENLIFVVTGLYSKGRNAVKVKNNGQLKKLNGEDYWETGEDNIKPTNAEPFLSLLDAIKIPFSTQLGILKRLIRQYRYIHLTDNHLKGISDAGPRERLSPSGDNLPNVLYYLQEKHPAVLATIIGELRRQIPALADVVTEMTSDERLLLRFRDAPFARPLPAQYMSDGTLRLAALLTLLHEPGATGLLGLEEPENELHPRLLPGLAELLLQAAETRQLLVATHAPALLNALAPEQVWVLHRGPDGYTQVTRTADLPGIPAMVEQGSPLGYLWQSNFFDVGDPLAGTGETTPARPPDAA